MTNSPSVDSNCGEDGHDSAWTKRCEAMYRAELSALYHQKRERFFELADKLTKAAALIGGSAALWKTTSPEFVAGVAMVITAASAMSLVFGLSDRARRHAELAKGFRDISSEIVGCGDHDFVLTDADTWMAKVYGLEAKEPPTLSALTVMCQNELAIAQNARSHVHPQTLTTRLLAHFFDMPLAS